MKLPPLSSRLDRLTGWSRRRRRLAKAVAITMTWAVLTPAVSTTAATDGWVHKRYDLGGVAGPVMSVRDPVAARRFCNQPTPILGQPAPVLEGCNIPMNDGTIDVGGAQFDPLGGTGRAVIEVRVVDSSGNHVGSVTVCNGEWWCDAPPVLLCSHGAGTRHVEIDRSRPITVKVWAATVCPMLTYTLVPVPMIYFDTAATSGVISLREDPDGFPEWWM